LNRAAGLGVRIPEDLAVVGFDSTDYCRELRPALTSIYQPLVPMGELAVDMLMHVINGTGEPASHVMLPCGLDVRESTCSSTSIQESHT